MTIVTPEGGMDRPPGQSEPAKAGCGQDCPPRPIDGGIFFDVVDDHDLERSGLPFQPEAELLGKGPDECVLFVDCASVVEGWLAGLRVKDVRLKVQLEIECAGEAGFVHDVTRCERRVHGLGEQRHGNSLIGGSKVAVRLEGGISRGFGLVEFGAVGSHHQRVNRDVSGLEMEGQPETLFEQRLEHQLDLRFGNGAGALADNIEYHIGGTLAPLRANYFPVLVPERHIEAVAEACVAERETGWRDFANQGIARGIGRKALEGSHIEGGRGFCGLRDDTAAGKADGDEQPHWNVAFLREDETAQESVYMN
jgi:hypothetical protein